MAVFPAGPPASAVPGLSVIMRGSESYLSTTFRKFGHVCVRGTAQSGGPKGQEHDSPGQSEAAPWVGTPRKPRPEGAQQIRTAGYVILLENMSTSCPSWLEKNDVAGLGKGGDRHL